MASTRTTKSLYDYYSIDYPTDPYINFSFWGNKYSLTLPNLLVKSAFALGIFTTIYHAKDIVKGVGSGFSYVFRRIAHLFKSNPEPGTVVIYGATNKVGRAFANKFASEGNKLILIDFSYERLERLRTTLLKFPNVYEENISCCVLDQTTAFVGPNEQTGLHEIYKLLRDAGKITYFINCRNIKRRKIEEFHKHKTEQVLLMSYYNMTAFAAILRKVLKIMNKTNSGRIICVNNTYGQEKVLMKSHPLFFATSQFAVAFTQCLTLTYKKQGINFLVVNNNFRNIASGRKYEQLVETAINSIGLDENIYI